MAISVTLSNIGCELGEHMEFGANGERTGFAETSEREKIIDFNIGMPIPPVQVGLLLVSTFSLCPSYADSHYGDLGL
jgi:hypothetical protein